MVTTKKPIVVFGGSFNPPTNAHFSLAEQIMNDYDIEKILFMPVGDNYPKPELLSASIRVEMLKEACKGYDRFEVSLIEVQNPKLLTTIETLEILKTAYHEHPIWFVMGTDNLKDFPNWNRYTDILAQFHLLVFERGDEHASDVIEQHEELKRWKHKILIMNPEIRTNCSSTLVRKRLKERKGARFLIPESVYQYIQLHGLYQ